MPQNESYLAILKTYDMINKIVLSIDRVNDLRQVYVNGMLSHNETKRAINHCIRC